MLDTLASHVRSLGRGWSLGTLDGLRSRWLFVRWPRWAGDKRETRLKAAEFP